MTTYQTQLTKALSERVIAPFWLGYFREALRGEINDQLLELYRHCAEKGVTKKEIADKLGRRPEQITRWLAAPSNLEVDTISDLALAMGCRPRIQVEKVVCDDHSQQRHEITSWIEQNNSKFVSPLPAPAMAAA